MSRLSRSISFCFAYFFGEFSSCNFDFELEVDLCDLTELESASDLASGTVFNGVVVFGVDVVANGDTFVEIGEFFVGVFEDFGEISIVSGRFAVAVGVVVAVVVVAGFQEVRAPLK